MIAPTSFKQLNKVAIVTGGGKRLGKAIAIELAKNGFDVVISYLQSKSGARDTVNQINLIGKRGLAVRTDVSIKKQVAHLIQTTIKNFGRIDLLVNNSSIFIESSLLKTSEEVWDRTIDVNLKGTFLCCQQVAPIMLKQKFGRIINIASLGGLQAWTQHLPYSVSKAGVIILTKILAKTLAPSICVNAIAPGIIQFNNRDNEQKKYLSKNRIPLKKYLKPNDVTDMVVYLASKGNNITGQIFPIDGGLSIL